MMPPTKLLVLSLVFATLFVSRTKADQPVNPVKVDASDSLNLKIQNERLKSKIQNLESHVNEKSKELKQKDGVIAEKEKAIDESSDRIVSLQSDVESIQGKEKSESIKQIGKAQSRAGELEKQAVRLEGELKARDSEKMNLETNAKEAEKKVHELNSKIDYLQKTNEDQRNRIQKTEVALKVTEEEIRKARSEVASRTRQLQEVHGAWLPPWLATQLIQYQTYLIKHGKPVWDTLVRKALEKKAQAQKWAEPYVEIIATKYIPAAKEQWLMVKSRAEPHVQSITQRTIEVYECSKATVAPHLIRVLEFMDPYVQGAIRFSKPYVDHVTAVIKPHVDKSRVALKPYTKKAVRVYSKFLRSATTYHRQVQGVVKETLNKHELTRSLATKELEWFAASALLALPVIILVRVFSSLSFKKGKRHVRKGQSAHGRGKAKRGHPNK